ncbi:MAG TPA: hypothetical protein VMY35_11420 [Phycisphaerae bacterium]|nr:hypothetical protein [Phycisphaerae bacterium]
MDEPRLGEIVHDDGDDLLVIWRPHRHAASLIHGDRPAIWAVVQYTYALWLPTEREDEDDL